MKATSIHRPEHRKLAELLREMRLDVGLTQVEAAAALGIAQTSLSDLEIGERGIDYLFVADACEVYGRTMVEFDALFKKALGRRKAKAPPRLLRKDKKSPD
jgi:transcriptional regulator with XRE-family HTH domain